MREPICLQTYLSNIHIRFFTWRKGALVGTDRFGHQYYREKVVPKGRRERRWVLYNGEPDASKVPAEWHGWLHHNQASALPEGGPSPKPWQKEHTPNRSGTLQAYRPEGHLLAGGQRARATGDYEPWTPA